MRKIKTWRDPYGEGFSTCRPREIEFKPGLTVLVGCNGAGKSTLLQNVSAVMDKENIPIMFFDNLRDGGHNAMEKAACHSNYNLFSALFTSSEGESLGINIGSMIQQVREFIRTGESEASLQKKKWNSIFREEPEEEKETELPPERWLLLDAADSGYSIDNVIDLKDVFGLMLEDAETEGVELYILISANEYELANGEDCFDVNAGKYITFDDYEDYKKFILKSRKKKDKRYERISG